MLKLNNITKIFDKLKAVNNVSFDIAKGTTMALVGASGSGKTTLARILTGIIKADKGTFDIDGKIDMVFQDPFSSLNPRMKVKDILSCGLRAAGSGKKEAYQESQEMLEVVNLPISYSNRYPDELSGGQRQRVAIARALIRRPEMIVLDEPVSSLDVSVQSDILCLLRRIQKEFGLTYLFISHDLRVTYYMADTIGVMLEGEMVEFNKKEKIYTDPLHKYTKKLVNLAREMTV